MKALLKLVVTNVKFVGKNNEHGKITNNNDLSPKSQIENMQYNDIPRSTILISAIIVGAALLSVPYLHEYIQISICSIEGVSTTLYYHYGYITGACSAERTWDDLFEISGGLVLGLSFLGLFALSLSQKWKIGILSALPIASFQFTEAYIATSKGFMYSHFPHLVPAVWIVVSVMVFVGMLYIVPKLTNRKIPKLGYLSTMYMLIIGTVTLGLLMHNFFLPEDVNTWKAVSVTTAVGMILYITNHRKNPSLSTTKSLSIMILMKN